MWRLADQQLDEFVSRGKCEFLDECARPFSGLVIADLLGVPSEDHEEFRAAFSGKVVGGIEDDSLTRAHNPLEYLNEKFSAYISERRQQPREDVLTELAAAKYPDGSTPDAIDVVRLATFVFAAGQETTTKLLSFAIRALAESPELQTLLRADRDRIPAFIEETLRMESPVKCHFRMARTTTSIGDVQIPAGSTVMPLPGASNRDARKFRSPSSSGSIAATSASMWRSDAATTHLPGAPLARAEGRISLNRALDRMSNITISQAAHRSPDARRYTYEPTWQMRGA